MQTWNSTWSSEATSYFIVFPCLCALNDNNYYIACFPFLSCMKLKGFRLAFLLAPTNTFFSKNHSCCISTEEARGRKEANQVTHTKKLHLKYVMICSMHCCSRTTKCLFDSFIFIQLYQIKLSLHLMINKINIYA